MKKKDKNKKKGGGPVTHKGVTAIGALPDSVGFSHGTGAWINPNKDELMYRAGFRTIDQMREEGLL